VPSRRASTSDTGRRCPACDGRHLEPSETAEQYQAEVPRTVIYRKFTLCIGRCRDCGRRVQGRHPLQTSDALGAAASQLGPDAPTRWPRT
jgi:transposase